MSGRPEPSRRRGTTPARKYQGGAYLIGFGLILAGLLFSQVASANQGVREGDSYVLHTPIYIGSNSDFTSANGVSTGNGTPISPYVIEAWEIGGPAVAGILIQDTTAYFVVRNVLLHSSTEGMFLRNVTNGRVENVTAWGNQIGISATRSENVVITNSSLISNEQIGISISLPSLVVVAENLISNHGTGIDLSFTSGVWVWKNTLVGTGSGIRVGFSTRSTVSENIFSNVGTGVLMEGSTDITVDGNSFTSNGVYIVGDLPTHYNSHTISSLNLVNGKPIRYEKNCAGLSIDRAFLGQVIVANCTNVTISGLDLSETDAGIQLAYVGDGLVVGNTISSIKRSAIYFFGSSRLTVASNTVLNCREGVAGWYSDDVLLLGNSFFSCNQGIRIEVSSRVRVFENQAAWNTGSGIMLHRATELIISSNEVRNNAIGIRLEVSDNVRLMNNVVSANGLGIFITQTSNATITGNLFFRNGLVFGTPLVFADTLRYFNTHTITPDNKVNGKPLLYYANCAGLGVAGISVGQLIVANCTSVRVSDLEIAYADAGIQMAYVTDVGITNVTITGGTLGISIHKSNAITVMESTASSVIGDAIFLGMVAEVRVGWSRVANSGTAVSLQVFSSNVTFDHNVVQGSTIGFVVSLSRGVDLKSNNIVYNDQGIAVEASTDVRVYHNNFVGNGAPAADMSPQSNSWDDGYPSGGNYWSDFAGVDFCSGPTQNLCPSPDGIVDIGYNIDSDTVDRYPLVEPFNVPPTASFVVFPEDGTVETLFTFDGSSSRDLEDKRELQVRWDWEDDGIWDTPWSLRLTSQHRYSDSGTYQVRLEVRDSQGGIGNFTRLVRVDPDMVPPRISHAPPGMAQGASTIIISAMVIDPGGVRQALVFFRGARDAEFQQLVMTNTGGDFYSARLQVPPNQAVLEYYLIASDEAGNLARAPQTGLYTIAIQSLPIRPSDLILPLSVVLLASVTLAYFFHRWRKKADSNSRPPGGTV